MTQAPRPDPSPSPSPAPDPAPSPSPGPAPSAPRPLPGQPLVLELKCSACGALTEHDARTAAVARHFPKGTLEDGWDGVALGRVFRCPSCGAIDQYSLSPQGRLTLGALTGAMLLRLQAGQKEEGGPISLGHFVLWDGTVVHRPSQAIAHLRSLAEGGQGGKSGEGWRRLGNLHDRLFEPEQAVSAWSKALDEDPAELEAVYSLATHHHQQGHGLEALRLAAEFLRRLPRNPSPRLRLEMCAQIADLLVERALEGGESRAVWLTWRGEGDEVGSGRIDLEPAMDRDVLTVFLASPALVGADLVRRDPALAKVPDGVLAAARQVLSEPARGAAQAPARRAEKVGRNDPCPCGSGKKHKKCCGR